MIPNIRNGATLSDLDEAAVAARERVKNSDADVLMAALEIIGRVATTPCCLHHRVLVLDENEYATTCAALYAVAFISEARAKGGH